MAIWPLSHTSPQLFEKIMSGGGEARLLGKWGEQLTARELRKKGWRVIKTNYRCRMGEIDIIAERGSFLAFVEVKLRKSDRFGTAGEAVNKGKQQRLRAAAELYLSQYPSGLQPRFDVVEIYAPQGVHTENPAVIHIENAF